MTNPHFKAQQAKIVAEASKERKQAEKERKRAQERDYYADLDWQRDRMYDGSDEQPYEPEEKELDNV